MDYFRMLGFLPSVYSYGGGGGGSARIPGECGGAGIVGLSSDFTGTTFCSHGGAFVEV